MDIRQLRYFLRVAELRSFTRAADELHVAQPALSRQVKLLEEELGLCLMHRHGRGVMLTEAGTELLTRSAHLVNAFDRLVIDMQRRAGAAERGSLTLGVPISLTRRITMPILARCRTDLPSVTLRVVEGHSELVADWLSSGKVDLAILFGDHPRRGIAAEPIGTEEVHAIVGAHSAWAQRKNVTAAELAGMTLALPRRSHSTWMMLDAAGIRPQHVIEADTLLEMLQAVYDGAGATLLAPSTVADEIAAGKLCAIPLAGGLMRSLVLAHATAHPQPSVSRLAAPLIRAEVADQIADSTRH
ncbi:MAG: LysR family transcriptional regulator [Rhodospirillales bacterium]|nr:LysR family transcriptional regulator [Rhodospirillales bacterium]